MSYFETKEKEELFLSKDFTYCAFSNVPRACILKLHLLIHLVGGKPSGKEVVQRRTMLEGILTAGFVQEDGYKVSRDSVLAYVDLDRDSVALLTRTVKHVFPRVSTWRDKDGMYPLQFKDIMCLFKWKNMIKFYVKNTCFNFY